MKKSTKQNIKENTYLLLIIAIVVLLIGVIHNNRIIKEKDREIEYLKHTENETEIIDINDIIKNTEDTENIEETKEKEDPYADLRAKKTELKTGKYIVGRKIDGTTDINPGTYNVYSKEGYGLLTGDLWQGFISETIGYSSFTKTTETYEELFLRKGDEIKIEGDCVLVFDPAK